MKSELEKQINELSECFRSCGKILAAIGDETRQYLILEMMKIGDCNGVRVGEITKKTNLSRPAVSHHLQILKDAGIVKVRKEGTKNYYYFDAEDGTFDKLTKTIGLAAEILSTLPDRSGDE